MTVDTAVELRRLDRAAVQPFLPQLSAWLLPGAFYGVQHTWPQLYRSDGDGRFLALFAGERLVSHCAYRLVALRTDAGVRRVSKPGRRIYAGKSRRQRVLGGMGIAIMSTSRGVVTSRTAEAEGIGGEVLCYVW